MLVRTLRAGPPVAGIVDVAPAGTTSRTQDASSCLNPRCTPPIAIAIQITIRWYDDGRLNSASIHGSSVARPFIALANQKPMGGCSHRQACFPFLPIAGIALPAAAEGELRVVRVRRHHNPAATTTDFAITAVAFPSGAEILLIGRMCIRRYLDGLATQALVVLHVAAIAVPIIAEGIQIGIRRHSDRHASFFDLAKSPRAFPVASNRARVSIARRRMLVGSGCDASVPREQRRYENQACRGEESPSWWDNAPQLAEPADHEASARTMAILSDEAIRMSTARRASARYRLRIAAASAAATKASNRNNI